MEMYSSEEDYVPVPEPVLNPSVEEILRKRKKTSGTKERKKEKKVQNQEDTMRRTESSEGVSHCLCVHAMACEKR